MIDLLVLIILAKLGGEDTLKGIAEWVRLRGESLKQLLGGEWKRMPHLSLQSTYGVTSLSPERCSPDRLLEFLRSHWHIENRLHYVRDVSLHEDACPARSSRIQRVLATLNNLVIGLIRRCDAVRYIPEARRFFAVHFDQAFQLLIT